MAAAVTEGQEDVSGRRALALIILVGAALRFAGLGHESYWTDESLTVWSAKLPLSDVIADVKLREISPPLYFLVVNMWSKLFGTGEAALRSLSALGGVLALVLFHAGARRVAGERAARIASLLFACAPFSIRYAQEARMYGLSVPLACGAFAYLAAELDRPAPHRFGPLAVLSLALLYTHAFGAFVPVLAFLWVLVRAGRREAARLALAHVPVALAFLPWLGVMLEQARARHGAFWIGRPDLSSVHYLAYVMAGGSPFPSDLPGVIPASRLLVRCAYPLLAVSLALSLREDSRTARATRLAAVGLSVPIAIAFGFSRVATPVFVDRYFVLLAPLFWLWLALAAERAGRFAWVVAGAYIALSLPVLFDHYALPHKEEWRPAVAHARASGRAADYHVDTGGMLVALIYADPAGPPLTSTVLEGFPQAHLAPAELLDALARARAFWLFQNHYYPDPAALDSVLRTRYEAVETRHFVGIVLTYYRRR